MFTMRFWIIITVMDYTTNGYIFLGNETKGISSQFFLIFYWWNLLVHLFFIALRKDLLYLSPSKDSKYWSLLDYQDWHDIMMHISYSVSSKNPILKWTWNHDRHDFPLDIKHVLYIFPFSYVYNSSYILLSQMFIIHPNSQMGTFL